MLATPRRRPEAAGCPHGDTKTRQKHAHLNTIVQHTEQEQFQLPPGVPLVSAELFVNLCIDSFRLLRLLAQAARHHGLQSHPPLVSAARFERDPSNTSASRFQLLSGAVQAAVGSAWEGRTDGRGWGRGAEPGASLSSCPPSRAELRLFTRMFTANHERLIHGDGGQQSPLRDAPCSVAASK